MILNEIFYAVKCDRCETVHGGGDYTYFDNESWAIEEAMDSDWQEVNGKHYCPDCYEIDEETDEVKVYEPYPDYIDKVMSFIKGGLKVGAILNETKDKFTISVSTYRVLNVNDYDIEYIKNILGDNLISINKNHDKYGTLQSVFEIKK